MTISDKYDKLRDRNHKNYTYSHYPKWVFNDQGKEICVKDEYDHEDLAPKDYSKDPYLADRRKEQAESRGNVLEIKARPLPKATAVPKVVKDPQKLDPKPEAKKSGSTLLANDEHS